MRQKCGARYVTDNATRRSRGPLLDFGQAPIARFHAGDETPGITASDGMHHGRSSVSVAETLGFRAL
jgi:hypothetical protein